MSASVYCASCGQQVVEGAQFCENCGASQSATTTPRRSEQTPGPTWAPGTVAPRMAPGGATTGSSLTQRGFFASLFDLSFTSLVATKVIKFLYVVSLILIVIYAVVLTIAAFRVSSALGAVVLLIGAPLLSLLYIIYTRVLLELFMAIFRIMENTSEIVAQGRSR